MDLWEDWCHDGDCGNNYEVGDNYGGCGDQHDVCDEDDKKKYARKCPTPFGGKINIG